MAKTKRTQKSKQEIMSETLRLRIIMLLILFIDVIGTLRLGIIGYYVHSAISFLVGNLYGVIYLTVAILCLYIIYKAQLPRFQGPEAIGLYLIYGSALILATIPLNEEVKGLNVINTYLMSHTFNKGGFIGTVFYGLCSSLFDRLGTLIFAIVFIMIGCALLFSKLYISYQSKEKKKIRDSVSSKRVEEQQPQTIILKKKSHFFDFFTKGETMTIFPDEAFDDPKDKPLDSSITSAFEFDDEKMQLDIKEISIDNHEKQEMEIKKEETLIDYSQKKTSSHYQLPPLLYGYLQRRFPFSLFYYPLFFSSINPVRINQTLRIPLPAE